MAKSGTISPFTVGGSISGATNIAKYDVFVLAISDGVKTGTFLYSRGTGKVTYGLISYDRDWCIITAELNTTNNTFSYTFERGAWTSTNGS